MAARDAIAVLDAEQVKKAVFVCQSLGGVVGLHAACFWPDRAAALVMCNTLLGFKLPEHLQQTVRAHRKKRNVKELRNQKAGSSSTGASLGGLALGAEFCRRNPELAYQYGVNAAFNHYANGGDEIIREAGGWYASVTAEQVQAVACPALVISSDYDPFFPPDALAEFASMLGREGAKLAHSNGHGHSVYFEDPDGFNCTVADFVAGALSLSP